MSTKAQELFETYREVQSAFEDVELSEESLIKLALTLYIDANKESPNSKWPGKQAASVPAGNDGDTRTVVGKLGDKRKEDATSKAGKPYSKFFYIVDGKEYNTIDKKIAAELSKAVVGQSKVQLQLQKNGKFENLVNAQVIQSEKQEPEFLEEDAPF
jgi:hypothetical protein